MDVQFFEPYLVKEAPQIVYYIPDFISVEEEQLLLRQIYNAPKPKWTYLSNRKLQDYGGVPHIKGMIPESIPAWLETYMDRISDLKVFTDKNDVVVRANHCLINEYEPAQGIMPHVDGPLFHPTITTISCGSHTILEFKEESRIDVCKLLLEPRSLVVMKADMYTKYLHSISEITKDIIDSDCVNLSHCKGIKVGDTLKRGTRISLTIRSVPKIIKCNIFNLINKK